MKKHLLYIAIGFVVGTLTALLVASLIWLSFLSTPYLELSWEAFLYLWVSGTVFGSFGGWLIGAGIGALAHNTQSGALGAVIGGIIGALGSVILAIILFFSFLIGPFSSIW